MKAFTIDFTKCLSKKQFTQLRRKRERLRKSIERDRRNNSKGKCDHLMPKELMYRMSKILTLEPGCIRRGEC